MIKEIIKIIIILEEIIGWVVGKNDGDFVGRVVGDGEGIGLEVRWDRVVDFERVSCDVFVIIKYDRYLNRNGK
jgi:hypothetical protein